MHTADTELAARCRKGDLSAFEELYRRHAGRLYNLAFRMLGNAADAEDLLQESFLAAHRKLDTFKGASSLGTWLYRLAMNQCLDHLRSRAAKMGQVTESLDNELRPRALAVPAGTGHLTVSRLDLERAIARLPPGCRAAFLLHDVEGFEHHEVGDILGVTEGTSKSQVHRARTKLREFLRGQDRPAAQRAASE